MSEWYFGEREIASEAVSPVREHWKCPKDCGGEMVFNGISWMTAEPGYHHTCTVCSLTLAIHGAKYPRIVYRPSDQPGERP